MYKKQKEEYQFSIQIEHSEQMQEHKSNLVEAMLRYFNKNKVYLQSYIKDKTKVEIVKPITKATDDEITSILSFFGYNTIDDKYTLKGAELRPDTVIYESYKAFWDKHNK